MSAKLTPRNIFYFLEGNLKMMGDSLNMLPKHQREQVLYRSSICGDCLVEGKCKECGCSLPGKFYVSDSCNGGKRFPNMMAEREWEEFKKTKNIEIRER
jgi:hypothetical protein